MSPSIKEIEVKIGRLIKSGDVLVGYPIGKDGRDLCFEEVTNSQESQDFVESRELTSIGSISTNSILDKRDNIWMGVIKLGNRTDLSGLEKLRLEIKNILKK